MELRHRRIRYIILRDLTVLVMGVAYIGFIQLTGMAIPCIVHKLTGYKCPGCGITRACVLFVNRDLKESFESNPFLYFVGPALVYLIIKADIYYVRIGSYDQGKADKVLTYLCIFAAVIYGVFRNIL